MMKANIYRIKLISYHIIYHSLTYYWDFLSPTNLDINSNGHILFGRSYTIGKLLARDGSATSIDDFAQSRRSLLRKPKLHEGSSGHQGLYLRLGYGWRLLWIYRPPKESIVYVIMRTKTTKIPFT